jgi:hypothetical protein
MLRINFAKNVDEAILKDNNILLSDSYNQMLSLIKDDTEMIYVYDILDLCFQTAALAGSINCLKTIYNISPRTEEQLNSALIKLCKIGKDNKGYYSSREYYLPEYGERKWNNQIQIFQWLQEKGADATYVAEFIDDNENDIRDQLNFICPMHALLWHGNEILLNYLLKSDLLTFDKEDLSYLYELYEYKEYFPALKMVCCIFYHYSDMDLKEDLLQFLFEYRDMIILNSLPLRYMLHKLNSDELIYLYNLSNQSNEIKQWICNILNISDDIFLNHVNPLI